MSRLRIARKEQPGLPTAVPCGTALAVHPQQTARKSWNKGGNMKKLLIIPAVAIFMMVTSGCSSMTSHTAKDSNHWLIKNSGLQVAGMGLIFSSEVYYCPPSGSACVLAEIEE